MHPFNDPMIARITHTAYREERLRDAAYYRVGQPSVMLRLVGGVASRFEFLSSRIRQWSQADSTTEVTATRWTETTR